MFVGKVNSYLAILFSRLPTIVLLSWYCTQSDLLRAVPIRELVGYAIGTSEGDIGVAAA